LKIRKIEYTISFMGPAQELYIGAVAAYAVGIAGGFGLHAARGKRPWGVALLCLLTLCGALLELGASISGLLAGSPLEWSFASGVP
jgi:hypothetical protein